MYRVHCEEVAKLHEVIKQVILRNTNWYLSVCLIFDGDWSMYIQSWILIEVEIISGNIYCTAIGKSTVNVGTSGLL